MTNISASQGDSDISLQSRRVRKQLKILNMTVWQQVITKYKVPVRGKSKESLQVETIIETTLRLHFPKLIPCSI